MSLYEFAKQDDAVHSILMDRELNRQKATDKINEYINRSAWSSANRTTRASVRRARAKLGVLSPLSPSVSGAAYTFEDTPLYRRITNRLFGYFR